MLEPHGVLKNTTRKYCLMTFHWMVTKQDFILIIKSYNHLVPHNEQSHKKILLNTFHLNGHTIGSGSFNRIVWLEVSFKTGERVNRPPRVYKSNRSRYFLGKQPGKTPTTLTKYKEFVIALRWNKEAIYWDSPMARRCHDWLSKGKIAVSQWQCCNSWQLKHRWKRLQK